MARVCILDYGSGNVRSVFNLFRGVCEHVIISNLVADIATATHLVLPGVGAFGAAMRRIGDTIPIAALLKQVLENGKPFLGICGSDFRMWAGTTFACSRGHCRPQLFDAAVIQSISNLDASHGMIERC